MCINHHHDHACLDNNHNFLCGFFLYGHLLDGHKHDIAHIDNMAIIITIVDTYSQIESHRIESQLTNQCNMPMHHFVMLTIYIYIIQEL